MQELALLGQHQAARVAVKQHDLQVALERRDLAAHGRLAHVQGIARVREAACFRRGVKDPELVPVHGSAPSDIVRRNRACGHKRWLSEKLHPRNVRLC